MGQALVWCSSKAGTNSEYFQYGNRVQFAPNCNLLKRNTLYRHGMRWENTRNHYDDLVAIAIVDFDFH